MGALFSSSEPSAKYEADEEDAIFEKYDDVKEYCKPLVKYCFFGQTTSQKAEHNDEANTKDVINLGLYLSLVTKLMHEYDPNELTGEEEEYLLLLKLIAMKRKKENESSEQCHIRLCKQSKRFIRIYKNRGKLSEGSHHEGYWGSRQQLLAGKVVGDWVDKENGQLDAIFGVLLNPTGGRVGPGDTGWFHNLLYDDTGFMAYHSCVHDSFGYLKTNHEVGPGYDYLNENTLADTNPMAGQISGIKLWKDILDDEGLKQLSVTI